MKFNRNTQKGQVGTNALWLVIVVILVIVGIKYYNDHHDDIVIHPPHIDVH